MHMYARVRAVVCSYFGAVEIEVGAGRRGTTLVLVAGAVDCRAVGVLGGRARAEKAELPDLHAGPQLDGQRRDVGQLQRDVPGESRIDPPGRRVSEQSQASERTFPL